MCGGAGGLGAFIWAPSAAPMIPWGHDTPTPLKTSLGSAMRTERPFTSPLLPTSQTLVLCPLHIDVPKGTVHVSVVDRQARVPYNSCPTVSATVHCGTGKQEPGNVNGFSPEGAPGETRRGRGGGGVPETWGCDCSACHISLGHRVWCQHGAFSGVGAFVASFVPAECPKGGGVCGVYSESP